MNKRIAVIMAVVALSGLFLGGCKKEEAPPTTEAPQAPPAAQTEPVAAEGAKSGEALFKEHCAVCHADGGNIINTQKTLHSKALAASKITTPEDIVNILRNPGKGMPKFDETTIPAKDATAIAEYVLKTFK